MQTNQIGPCPECGIPAEPVENSDYFRPMCKCLCGGKFTAQELKDIYDRHSGLIESDGAKCQ